MPDSEPVHIMSKTSPLPYRHIYILVSLTLAVPVLLWPLAWLAGNFTGANAGILQRWLATSICLLMAAIVADSILRGMQAGRNVLGGITWIVAGSMISSLASHASSGMFLIACLFALHMLRSGIPLWRDEKEWWLWPAWIRDAATSLILFGWLIILTHA